MSFPWSEYLTLAEALVRQRTTFANEEACCRAAISRAYYAAFCAARNHARDHEGLTLPKRNRGRVHQVVIEYYNNRPSGQHKNIGWTLHQLRNSRNKADYDDPNIPRVFDVAQNAVRQAHQVFEGIQRLSP